MKYLAAALVALAAALYLAPSADHFPGYGGDPHFNLWTLEVVYSRIAAHGPLWFLDLENWRTQIFAGADYGLAYSENQIWLGLLTYLPYRLLHSAALTLQLYMVAATVLTYAAMYLFLRKRTRYAVALAAFFATSGWIQSQVSHLQAFALFTLPLAALALERFRKDPSALTALLLGASVGWISGWNLYYFCFAAVFLLPARGRQQLAPTLLAIATAALVAWPLLRPYVLLDRALGAHPALLSYGLHPGDLIARLHAPRLLWPSIEARGEPGGMPVIWVLLLVAALFLRKARPWAIASAIAFWVSTGSELSAWQTLGWLPGVSSLRAIGRVHVVTLALSLPAIAAMLEALPSKVAGLAIALLFAETLPAGRAERVAVQQDRPAPAVAIQGPLLILPPPDPATMYALLPWGITYQGGYSGFAPPGQELLEATWRRNQASALLANARNVLARTPEAAALVRNQALKETATPSGILFELRPTPLLDPLADTIAKESLDLFARRAGTLSIDRIDHCFLQTTTSLGSLHLQTKSKLQGSEFLALQVDEGQLIYRHRLHRLIDGWPAVKTLLSIQCD